MRSLFLFNPADLESDPPGGVQLCSREFLAYVEAASETVIKFPVTMHHRAQARILRQIGAAPYRSYVVGSSRECLKQTILRHDISHVFINKAELMRFAAAIQGLRLPVKNILMSHGNQSGDDLADIAGAPKGSAGLSRARSALALGLNLIAESEHRRSFLDGVCVMSEEERVLETWLGTRNTLVLPRLLSRSPIEWRPTRGRVGYVGTLSHPPNRRALESVFEDLGKRPPGHVEIRLVGQPSSSGIDFARSYPFVKYLGALSDDDLRAEASTWAAFLNPIFGLARGASMKLSEALRLGLPVVSTQLGARGYDFGSCPFPVTENTPASFVDAMLDLVSAPGALESAADLSRRTVASAPTLGQIGHRLQQFGLALA
jgi:glycosyltransferase involved in cell wall biosynthesis